jgi:hypothetical protein
MLAQEFIPGVATPSRTPFRIPKIDLEYDERYIWD